MAEKPAAERTEEPTPDRLKKAREEGQIPQSQEVPSAMMIGALLLGLSLLGGRLCQGFADEVRSALTLGPGTLTGGMTLGGVLHAKGAAALGLAAPFLALAAGVSVFSSLLASGWAFSPKAVRFRLDRVNPVSGLAKLFSTRSLMKLVLSLLKLAVISLLVWSYARDKLGHFLALRWATPAGTVLGISRLVFGLMVRVAIGIVVIAAIDLIWQRRKYKKDLKMTRQEVKEERKQHELSPELRGRIRSVQMEMVRKRMLQDVPAADVVLTNPTHVAVALKYDSDTMAAPNLVAKGGDLLAQRIKEIAREHGVPVVEKPELARAVFAACEVGQPIPEVLFVAVAEVLAMIYRLRRKREPNR